MKSFFHSILKIYYKNRDLKKKTRRNKKKKVRHFLEKMAFLMDFFFFFTPEALLNNLKSMNTFNQQENEEIFMIYDS